MKKLSSRTLLALFVLSTITTISEAQTKRALWVWHARDIINNVGTARATLFDFCAKPHGSQDSRTVAESSQPITTLYLYAHSFVNGDSTKKANLRSFLADAHARNIEVEFLDGAADWATTGAGYAKQYIDHVINFNNGTTDPAKRFDGIQYDVEPYLLDSWFSQSVWNGFITLLKDCQAKVDAASTTLRFGAAIPRWYDANPGRAYLLEVQKAVDYVAVMNYVDHSKGMISDAKNEMFFADSLGKKIVLGVETLDIDPASVTFAEEGWSNMEARLYDVQKAYGASPNLAAIAIHEYDPYKALSKYGTTGKDMTAPVIQSYGYAWPSDKGQITVKLADICGTGVSSSGSLSGVKIYNNGSSLAGKWTGSSTTGLLTFVPTNYLDNGGAIKLIVNPKDASGNVRRDTLLFNIAARPTLNFPLSGATNLLTSFTIKWRKALHAVKYKLQISTSSDFSNVVIQDTSVTDTSKLLSGLIGLKKYYWRVLAISANSASRYSTTSNFTTIATTVIAQRSEPEETMTEAVKTNETYRSYESYRTYETYETYETPKPATLSAINYPNPATEQTSFDVTLPNSGLVSIKLFDQFGKLVSVISETELTEGKHTIPFNVAGLQPGAYTYVVSTTTDQISRRMLIRK